MLLFESSSDLNELRMYSPELSAPESYRRWYASCPKMTLSENFLSMRRHSTSRTGGVLVEINREVGDTLTSESCPSTRADLNKNTAADFHSISSLVRSRKLRFTVPRARRSRMGSQVAVERRTGGATLSKKQRQQSAAVLPTGCIIPRCSRLAASLLPLGERWRDLKAIGH